MSQPIRVAIIGCGGIALQNHIPGIHLHPHGQVTLLCDSNHEAMAAAAKQWSIGQTENTWETAVTRDDIDAVVIATPNFLHHPMATAALRAGKHVLLEKPVAMDTDQARDLVATADASGCRHMTAFTYRFVPAFNTVRRLLREGAIGRPFHFRAQRFQDWGTRNLGWRQQSRLCATGELGDMLSHRLDFALELMGPVEALDARMKQFIPDREGNASDVDDWVAVICEFASGATGVLESTKLATGRGEGVRSHDVCEINGEEGTLVYSLMKPYEYQIGKPGGLELETRAVPNDLRVWPGSPRNADEGDIQVAFRYDQGYEFIEAIIERRDCVPTLHQGAAVQELMQRIIDSANT